jgi:hypothetical protein
MRPSTSPGALRFRDDKRAARANRHAHSRGNSSKKFWKMEILFRRRAALLSSQKRSARLTIDPAKSLRPDLGFAADCRLPPAQMQVKMERYAMDDAFARRVLRLERGSGSGSGGGQ